MTQCKKLTFFKRTFTKPVPKCRKEGDNLYNTNNQKSMKMFKLVKN